MRASCQQIKHLRGRTVLHVSTPSLSLRSLPAHQQLVTYTLERPSCVIGHLLFFFARSRESDEDWGGFRISTFSFSTVPYVVHCRRKNCTNFRTMVPCVVHCRLKNHTNRVSTSAPAGRKLDVSALVVSTCPLLLSFHLLAFSTSDSLACRNTSPPPPLKILLTKDLSTFVFEECDVKHINPAGGPRSRTPSPGIRPPIVPIVDIGFVGMTG